MGMAVRAIPIFHSSSFIITPVRPELLQSQTWSPSMRRTSRSRSSRVSMSVSVVHVRSPLTLCPMLAGISESTIE